MKPGLYDNAQVRVGPDGKIVEVRAGGVILGPTGVRPGTYSLPTITVDEQGRVTSISTGAANAVWQASPPWGGASSYSGPAFLPFGGGYQSYLSYQDYEAGWWRVPLGGIKVRRLHLGLSHCDCIHTFELIHAATPFNEVGDGDGGASGTLTTIATLIVPVGTVSAIGGDTEYAVSSGWLTLRDTPAALTSARLSGGFEWQIA